MAHLQRLLAFDPDAFFFVVIDNASAHTTEQLDPFWQTHKGRLEPVFLPTYSPHLNLIERLWRMMRGQMTKNQFYPTLIALCEAVVEWLERLPFEQFCSIIGIDDKQLDFR
jgi:transposase